MRRVALALAAAAVVTAVLATVPAGAQTRAASLALRSQTPWTTTDAPVVTIRLLARNTGDTRLGDLSVSLEVRSAVTTRTAYEDALREDAGGVLAERVTDLDGALEPGETTQVDLAIDLSEIGLRDDLSGIHPLRVALRSADEELAVVRSPVMNIVRAPIAPLGLTWSIVLSSPVRFTPRGAFLGDALAEDLAPGGHLGATIAALADLAAEPDGEVVDLIVAPTLLLQLDRMRRGYAVQRSDDPYDVGSVAEGEGGALRAADAMDALAAIAASGRVRLGTMPYGAAPLPALLAAGLGDDAAAQLDAAADETERLLGVRPDPSVLRPPADALDAPTLAFLAERGVRALVLDPGALALPEVALGFAPPAEAPLAAGDTTIAALAPNAAIAELLADPVLAADPVLLAHAALGELAAIWQEAPGNARTVAVAFTEDAPIPAGFLAAFLDIVGGAPWIATRGAAEVAADLDPDAAPVELAAPSVLRFPAAYTTAIREARARLAVAASMLAEDSPEPGRLARLLLVAEGVEFVDDVERGRGFIDRVDGDASALLRSVRPLPGQQVTLTSSGGSVVPVRVENLAPQPLRASIRLVSQHLADGAEQAIVLEPGEIRTLTFEVSPKTSGRFPVQIQVVSPGGDVVSTTTLFVRSTQLNRQALAIVIAAGVLLVLLWARRFLPGRRAA